MFTGLVFIRSDKENEEVKWLRKNKIEEIWRTNMGRRSNDDGKEDLES